MAALDDMIFKGYPAIGLISYALFAIILAIQFRSLISIRPKFGGWSLYFASFLHLIVAVFFIFIDDTHRALAHFSYLLFLMGLYLAWTGAQNLRVPYIVVSLAHLLCLIGFTGSLGFSAPIHRAAVPAVPNSISDLNKSAYYEYLAVIATVAYYATGYAVLIVASDK